MAWRTNDCIGNEDMEKAIAVKVELKQCRYSLAGCNRELSVAVRTAGHIDAVPQQVEGTHDHVLRVPWKAEVKVPWQDLFLHVEKVFHQLRQHHALDQSVLYFSNSFPSSYIGLPAEGSGILLKHRGGGRGCRRSNISNRERHLTLLCRSMWYLDHLSVIEGTCWEVNKNRRGNNGTCSDRWSGRRC